MVENLMLQISVADIGDEQILFGPAAWPGLGGCPPTGRGPGQEYGLKIPT